MEIHKYKVNMNGDYELEVLQWGKTSHSNVELKLENVIKVYEPETDGMSVEYYKGKFTEIPEWLFSKKITNQKMSRFTECERITSIPENLFKHNVNVTSFYYTFNDCRGITSIPENLFKNNVNVTSFDYTFNGCRGITSVPENLFKYNVNATNFTGIFRECEGITSIPENLFKNNVNVTDFYSTFERCRELLYIPNTIIEHAKRVKEKGGNVGDMFKDCTKASNYNSLPEYMK